MTIVNVVLVFFVVVFLAHVAKNVAFKLYFKKLLAGD